MTKKELEARIEELELENTQLREALADQNSETVTPTRALRVSEDEKAAQAHALRVEHNERTGGGPVKENELQQARDEHNERTGDASRSSWGRTNG